MGNAKALFERLKQERTGMENYNHQGLHMVIKNYYGVRKVDVVFDDGFEKTTDYKSFIKGSVRNDNYIAATVAEIGICLGKYRPKDYPKEYKSWMNMLCRCTSEQYKIMHPTYANVTCVTEWLIFDNYCKWVLKQENYAALCGTQWSPDKDILYKGNKLYSPDTVCLVPQNVNKLFLKHDSHHGEFPIGVTINKNAKINKYVARCNNPFGKNWSQNCSTIEEAFTAYKIKKEEIIREVAQVEYQKGNITKRCYEAMINYEVEITD